MKRIYDISQALHESIAVWPGDPPYRHTSIEAIAAGAAFNLSEIQLGLHTGTHVDAPRHFNDSGLDAAALELDRCLGPCRVVHIPMIPAVGPDYFNKWTDSPSRVLIRTDSASPDRFSSEYASLTETAARRLIELGILLVGIDAPSVDPADSLEHPAHRLFAEAGIPILENLKLTDIPPGDYELIALPLKLKDAEAAPIRAILREL